MTNSIHAAIHEHAREHRAGDTAEDLHRTTPAKYLRSGRIMPPVYPSHGTPMRANADLTGIAARGPSHRAASSIVRPETRKPKAQAERRHAFAHTPHPRNGTGVPAPRQEV